MSSNLLDINDQLYQQCEKVLTFKSYKGVEWSFFHNKISQLRAVNARVLLYTGSQIRQSACLHRIIELSGQTDELHSSCYRANTFISIKWIGIVNSVEICINCHQAKSIMPSRWYAGIDMINVEEMRDGLSAAIYTFMIEIGSEVTKKVWSRFEL